MTSLGATSLRAPTRGPPERSAIKSEGSENPSRSDLDTAPPARGFAKSRVEGPEPSDGAGPIVQGNLRAGSRPKA